MGKRRRGREVVGKCQNTARGREKEGKNEWAGW